MPKFNEFTFLSTDGKTDIYVREFIPDSEIIGTVQIAHGVAEHCARYDDFCRYLAGLGFAVCANDHLGHGKSVIDEEHRGFFDENDGWFKVAADMKQLRDIQKAKYPEVGNALLGHSMGSFLTRTYMIRYPNDFDAIILSGTGQMNRFILNIGYSMAKSEARKMGPMYHSKKLYDTAFSGYNKQIENPKTENDWLSRNEENVRLYGEDPLCGGISSCGLYRDMMGGMLFNCNKRNLVKMNLNVPVLFIAGTKDPVGDYGKGVVKTCELFQWARMKDLTLKLYENDRHEVLNEIDKDDVYADVHAWLCKKIVRGTALSSPEGI